MVKNLPAMQKAQVQSLGQEDPLEKGPVTHSSAFPGASQVVLVVKNPAANAGDERDLSLIPGLGRFPGGGHSKPFQYSCLENRMDRGAWWAMVHMVAKS